ncbi:sulfatase-like hydrolase/transferase [Cellulophaga sp. F20128]|uniref:sulfatase family protein n=1 Tax=Cellulophaga sp. F20128 TaxID=2926413 RepID=UPI001FF37CE3|nr:sulfatase-like hydrolase/transferase [Cellulophaga sp. F20128]MCK0158203.1 sulfatase-like hydrolase/transferase [Cellulophaga sp. F20128]
MTKKYYTLTLLICFAFTSCTDNKKTIPTEKPNIILIMVDDLGWNDVGFNGNTTIKTPNLDGLAAAGVTFNRFYSASPVCSPTRASVMTGRHPKRTNINNANDGHLREGEITIAEIVKKEGYATAHFGKWHLGTLTKKELDANRGGNPKFATDFTIPTMHGYDSFFSTESKVPTFDPLVYPKTFDEGESKQYGWKAVTTGDSQSYGTSYWIGNEIKETENLSGSDTKIIMDRVLPFIDKSADNKTPFFTTVWIHTPHLPLVTDSIHRAMYADMPLKEQLLFGAITEMDEQIGRLWQHLEAKGLDENTILWFCSDNGPERNTPGSALPFRERKRSLYEGGIRVPAFVVWKDKLNANTHTDFPAVTSDYLPTVLDILNLPKPDDRPLDGVSLLPIIQENKSIRNAPIGFEYQHRLSWVNDTFKLISVDKGVTFELYDLLKDPSEKNNIAADNKAMVEKLKKELQQWMASVKNSQNGNDYN